VAAPLELSVFGTRLVVATDELNDVQRGELATIWARCASATVDAPSVRVAMPTGSSWEGRAARLSSAVTVASMESRRGRLVLLHAGAVAHPDGRVAAFVGRSGHGKTTASIALGRRFGYVSDETAAVTFTGTVLPYPKPLSVITDGIESKRQVAPDELGLLPIDPAVPLGLDRLLLLDRSDEASLEPVIEEVGTVEALETVVRQVSFFPELDRPLERILALFDRVGGVLRVRYREAERLPDVIEGLFAGTIAARRRRVGWRAVDVAPTAGGESSASGPSDPVGAPVAYRRAAVDEAVEVDGRLVLRRGVAVTVVDGIGPIVWAAVDGVASTDEIVVAVVERIGPPTDGRADELVLRALEELAASGILQPPHSA
jgi:hypothetical protein